MSSSTLKGLKFDSGKLRWDLMPVNAEESVVGVITYGANKYEAENWRILISEPGGVQRYYAAVMRHLSAWRKGEFLDPESGKPHLACAITSLLFILEKEICERVFPSIILKAVAKLKQVKCLTIKPQIKGASKRRSHIRRVNATIAPTSKSIVKVPHK